MTENLVILITAVLTLILGFVLGYLIANLKAKNTTNTLNAQLDQQALNENRLEDSLKKAESKLESTQEELAIIQQQLTRRNVELENLQARMHEKAQELEKLQEKFTKDFEIVANKILDEKSSKFTIQNRENLDVILKPLQERINSFEKRVEETNKESLGRHSELRQQIKGLAELNLQMSKDADNLTKALKGDSKIQGNWGEMILTRVLEKSGLEKGREYTLQDSHSDDSGKRHQTDVLIHLPDGKTMIVDSKVSLTAFERFASEEDDAQKTIFLKQHILSVRRHVEQLSNKNYQQLLETSPDTVFMFIPIEPAFAIASASEPRLYEDAFNKNVIIVTPSTLFAALRLVENLWQNDRQKKNALDIATQAGSLYDSFSNLLNDLEKLGRQLGTVRNTYESSLKKLTGRGNLINRVDKLKKLGAKTNKQIDPKMLNQSDEDE
ncbi:MAG: DNA recombination protein RmuC [Leeuwenhoekiella sp.]